MMGIKVIVHYNSWFVISFTKKSWCLPNKHATSIDEESKVQVHCFLFESSIFSYSSPIFSSLTWSGRKCFIYIFCCKIDNIADNKWNLILVFERFSGGWQKNWLWAVTSNSLSLWMRTHLIIFLKIVKAKAAQKFFFKHCVQTLASVILLGREGQQILHTMPLNKATHWTLCLYQPSADIVDEVLQ